MRIFIVSLCLFALSCQRDQGPLPKLGQFEIVNGDTIFHMIPDFNLLNQDSVKVNNSDFASHVYVADFFFTSCPSICPIVKKQMLRIYDRFENDETLKLVSHTIDPKRDTPSKLYKYANALSVDTDKWMFLTGEKDTLMDLAAEYLVSAMEDPEAPGGFDHSGMIVLIDKNRHIRSFGNGTEKEEVDQLMKDIDRLLAEYEGK